MNLKPLDDRIVVKPSEAEQTTASGLVIPDTAKEKPQQGTVLAVGPGRWSDSEGKFFPPHSPPVLTYTTETGTSHAKDAEIRRRSTPRS